MTEDEWKNVPEVGDARNRKQRNPRAEKFTPLPDSVLTRNLGGDTSNSLDPSSGLASMMPGVQTPGNNVIYLCIIYILLLINLRNVDTNRRYGFAKNRPS